MQFFLSSIKIELLGMSYLIKTLLKEAKDTLDQYGTSGHAALQLSYLWFHLVYFLFQIYECRVAPVQGNTTFAKYLSNYNWCTVNSSLILNQKVDIDEEHTKDMCITNM